MLTEDGLSDKLGSWRTTLWQPQRVLEPVCAWGRTDSPQTQADGSQTSGSEKQRPTFFQQQRRRLTARSIHVPVRHRDSAPAVNTEVVKLYGGAQAFTDAFDLVRASTVR